MSDVALPSELERLLAENDGAFYADEAAARAIAMVIKLFEDDHYSWPEWVDKFGAEIDAPGHFRNSPEDAEKAEAVLSGGASNIHRNYAGLWLAACEKLLLEKGLVTQSELDGGFAAPDEMKGTGKKTEVEAQAAGHDFAVNQRVVVRDVEPAATAHLPLFVRGKTGVIERRLGDAADSDSGGEPPGPIYNVRFAARELWGPDAAPKDSVNFSIPDRYLTPA